jgi:hypothetical protein
MGKHSLHGDLRGKSSGGVYRASAVDKRGQKINDFRIGPAARHDFHRPNIRRHIEMCIEDAFRPFDAIDELACRVRRRVTRQDGVRRTHNGMCHDL